MENIIVKDAEVVSNEPKQLEGESITVTAEEGRNMEISSLENITKTAYEVCRAYSQGIGRGALPWENMSKSQRLRGMEAVEMLLSKGVKSPSAVHDLWISNMISDGWVYGKDFCGEKLTHPMMLNYKSLPPQERTKDKLFSIVVNSF